MPSSSSRPSSSSSSSSRQTKPQTADDLRATEHAVWIQSLLTSHTGYLGPIIHLFSTALEVSPTTTAIGLGVIYLALHLVTPAFLLPHLSALVTLIVPVSATMRSIAVEKSKEKTYGPTAAQDAPQWSLYWVIYCLFELARGWIGIWAPGCKAHFEIVRTAGLVTVGGPWFGTAGLIPPGPSEALLKLEKVDKAQADAAQAKDARDKAKVDKAKADKAKADKAKANKAKADKAKADKAKVGKT